jgi:NADPH-dependent curcumin reductase CurA
MGSGLSLTYDQVKNIIERDLNIKFKELEYQKDLNRYTDDGIEIFYDFSNEEKLIKQKREIYEFIKKSKNKNKIF